MKKTILSILTLFPVIGFSQYGLMTPPSAGIAQKQEIKQAKKNLDSIFIEGRYIGLIDSGTIAITLNSTNSITYKVILDDFVNKEEKEIIMKRCPNKSDYANQFIFTSRFASRTKIEIAGFYTKQAGELMNSRNNWRIGGALIATAIVLVAPPTLVVYSAAALVGGVSSIVSLCKDYKANAMLKKAGDVMMSR